MNHHSIHLFPPRFSTSTGMFPIQWPTIATDMKPQEDLVKTTCDLFFCSDMQLDIHDVSATLLLYKTADPNFQTTFIQYKEIT